MEIKDKFPENIKIKNYKYAGGKHIYTLEFSNNYGLLINKNYNGRKPCWNLTPTKFYSEEKFSRHDIELTSVVPNEELLSKILKYYEKYGKLTS